MVEVSKYCSDVMKKCFNKELVTTEKDVIDFENSTKCLTCDNGFYSDANVWDHCHITRKYRGSTLTVCDIKVKLNSCHISQPKKLWFQSHYARTSKFNFKINLIPNGLDDTWALTSIIS